MFWGVFGFKRVKKTRLLSADPSLEKAGAHGTFGRSWGLSPRGAWTDPLRIPGKRLLRRNLCLWPCWKPAPDQGHPVEGPLPGCTHGKPPGTHGVLPWGSLRWSTVKSTIPSRGPLNAATLPVALHALCAKPLQVLTSLSAKIIIKVVKKSARIVTIMIIMPAEIIIKY